MDVWSVVVVLSVIIEFIVYCEMLQSSYKLTRKNFQSEFQLQNDLAFYNTHYPFPNDLQTFNKYKSFKTIFEFNGTELPQHYTKKLSLLNRIHYTIKLKQIKREEINPDANSTHFIRYLLYYEPVPFSLAFARENSTHFSFSPSKLQKILYETVKDLIDLNIYCELTASYCGFTENGEFRIFIPPFSVLNERKLYTTDKQAIMSSADRIVRFWQAQTQKPRETTLIEQLPRNSYRFNSPQLKKDNQDHRNSENQSIDVKKTIKLLKNYQKETNQPKNTANQKTPGKGHELKKHKSMETLQYQERTQPKKQEKKGFQYLSKMNELNKKISNIREAIKIKKDSIEIRKTSFQLLPNKNLAQTNTNSPKNIQTALQLQQNIEGEVIFDKYKDIPSPKNTIKSQQKQSFRPQRTQNRQSSLDTYEQQMGRDFGGVSFQPSSKLRRTAQPVLQKLANENKSNESNWHHESAGNRVLKRIIQKNKEICPEIFQVKEHASLSKQPVGRFQEPEVSLRSGNSNNEKPREGGGRLKKMVSVDNFESHAQTKSINLSQFSKQLSSVKRRRERQQKNKQMKQKVQQILLKSKKAIELLKNPKLASK